jgi:hypothetical protein
MGRFTLGALRAQHQDDCALYSVRGEPDVVVKTKAAPLMENELEFAALLAEQAELPLFRVGKKRLGQVAFSAGSGLLAMRRFRGSLAGTPLRIVATHWRPIVAEVAAQLARMHAAAQMVHSDVKAANILLDWTDAGAAAAPPAVALCDFGLTQRMADVEGAPASAVLGGAIAYFVHQAGARLAHPLGPRADFEALLLAVGERLRAALGDAAVDAPHEPVYLPPPASQFALAELDARREWPAMARRLPRVMAPAIEAVRSQPWSRDFDVRPLLAAVGAA